MSERGLRGHRRRWGRWGRYAFIPTVYFILYLILIIFILTPVSASANTAPLHNEGSQSSEVFVLEQDCPIIIKHENISFDYRDLDKATSRVGRISISYEMYNPTGAEMDIRLALPYINNQNNVHASDISITSNGAYLPWEYYSRELDGNSINDKYSSAPKQLTMENILQAVDINDEIYNPEHFDLYTEGVLYQFSNLAGSISLEMDDKYRPRSIFNNINVSFIANNQYMYNSVYGVAECDIFSLNGPISYSLSGSCNENNAAMTLEEYLEDFRGEFWMSNGYRINNLRNFWLNELDKNLANPDWHARGVLNHSDDVRPNMNLLVFDVTFPPYGDCDVTIAYPSYLFIDGSLNNENNITYEEIYLMNPASYWAEFQSLDINIITPPFAPRIVKSSLKLYNAEPDTYTAHYDGMPKKDLSFTMRSGRFTALDILLIFAIISLVAIVASIYFRKRRRPSDAP